MKWYGKVLILIGLVVVISGCSNKATPQDILNEYLSDWGEMDYKKMYEHLSQGSKSRITKKEFVERYQKIYKGIEIENLQVNGLYEQNDDEEPDGDSVTFSYTIKMETMAGPIDATHQVTLVKDKNGSNQEWVVEWDPSLIFPSLEEGERVVAQTLKASRGEIFDKNGTGLAINGVAYVVGIIPSELGDDPANSKTRLAKLLDLSVEQIEGKLNASWVESDLFVPIATLTMKEKNLERYTEIPGVTYREKIVRTYPMGASAAQLTGYVREISAEQLGKLKDKGYSSGDMIGKKGLEQIFEEKLRGKNGGHIFIVRPDGSFKETLAKTEPVNGEDIMLTIDAELQQRIFNQFKGDSGTATAIHPKTGAILSLVSSPSYDPNAFVRGLTSDQWDEWSNDPDKPLLNRFTNRYAPGSVFKTITAAIGLENGVTEPDDTRQIDGLHWAKDNSWGSYYVTRVSDIESVNLRDAFVYSDNIYFAQEALEIGKDRFIKEAETFGFGEELPIPYFIKPSQLANDGIDHEIHLADSAYGQGEVMMSPLHLALIYTPFANEGDMVSPHLMKDEESKVWKENLISPETANLIKEDLIQVVEDPKGTAHSASISGMTIAGKSGTAEIKKSKEDKTGTENGWFVGFNTGEPNLLLVMMIEDVKQRGGSGYVIPKARNVFKSLQE
ncbi:penicillin-binding transpeptidase domain-containing protein [Pseudalkalibacillus sp. A8]|uniref:penicillin-binding transpeptidase domain-containing protein n=1 Tax=Pseudalkalibacillus sp. A8 TaxID=3382641 RepID=UPI0038B45CFB